MTASVLNDVVDWCADHPAVVAWVAGIVAVLVPVAVTAISRRRAERRARYAVMAATLAAWCELPYRIRRRTSNSQACLDTIAGQMHDLQQQLVLDCVDLRTECAWLADLRDDIQATIRRETMPWIHDAWTTPPMTTTAGMNLHGWGPAGLDAHIETFALAARWRFGWRRALNPIRRFGGWPTHSERR